MSMSYLDYRIKHRQHQQDAGQEKPSTAPSAGSAAGASASETKAAGKKNSAAGSSFLDFKVNKRNEQIKNGNIQTPQTYSPMHRMTDAQMTGSAVPSAGIQFDRSQGMLRRRSNQDAQTYMQNHQNWNPYAPKEPQQPYSRELYDAALAAVANRTGAGRSKLYGDYMKESADAMGKVINLPGFGMRYPGLAAQEYGKRNSKLEADTEYIRNKQNRNLSGASDAVRPGAEGEEIFKGRGILAPNDPILQNAMMSDEQKRTYNYIYATQGAEEAEKFRNTALEEGGVNAMIAQRAFDADLKNSGLPAKAAATYMGAVEGAVDSLSGVPAWVKGEEQYRPRSTADYFSSVAVQSEPEGSPARIGLELAQSAGTNTPAHLASVVGGPAIGSAVFAAQAGARAYDESLREGHSVGEATAYGAMQALDEEITNYLLGGLTAYGGGAVQRTIGRTPVAQMVGRELQGLMQTETGRYAMRQLMDAFANNSGEAAQEYLQHFTEDFEKWVAYNHDNFNITTEEGRQNLSGAVPTREEIARALLDPDALHEALIGFLNAGVMNAPGQVSDVMDIMSRGQNSDIGSDGYAAFADSIDVNPLHYSDADTYHAARDLRSMAQDYSDRNTLGMPTTTFERGLIDRAAEEFVNRAAEDSRQMRPVEEDRRKDNRIIRDEYIRNMMHPAEEAEMRDIGRRAKSEESMQNITSAIKTAQEIAQTDETKAKAEEISVRAADIAKRRAEGKQVTDAEVGRLVNDTIRATMAAGNERAAAAAEARSRIGFGEQGASVIESSKASGQKLEAMTAAYEEARYNIPRNDAQKQLASGLLSEQEFSAAYQAGIQDRNAFYNNDYSEKIGKISEKYRPGNIKRGTVTYDGVDMKALENAGDKESRTKYAQMKTIEHFLSGTLGYNVEWFESKTEDGRYTGENGSYTHSKHLIRLDVNAGADVIGDKVKFASVISHELTHTIEDGSPVQYQKLADSVMKMLVADQEYSQGRNAEQIVADMIENNPYVSNEADAIHELVAQACEDMMSGNRDVRAMFEGMSEAEQKTIFDHIKSIFAAIKNFFDEMLNSEAVRSNRTEAAAIRRAKENIEALQKEWTEGVKQAAAYNAAAYEEAQRQSAERSKQNEQMENAFGDDTGRITRDDDGDVVIAESKDGEKLVYSLKTLPTTQEKLASVLKRKGYSEESIKAAQNQVQTVADMLTRVSTYYAEMADALDAELLVDPKTGKTVLHSFVTNGDYPVNIDFLTICKKREAYMHVLTDLIEHGVFDKVAFDGAAIATTNEILRDSGFETACACCFVESRRLQIQRWAETFCSEWNEEVLKRNPNATPFNFSKGDRGANDLTQDELVELDKELRSLTKKEKNNKGNYKISKQGARAKMGPLLDRIPALGHTLSVGDLITPNGIDSLRALDGNLFSLVKQRYGTATPKIAQAFSPYNGDVADLSYGFMRTEIKENITGSKKYKDQAKKELIKEGVEKPTAQQVEDRALRKYLYDIGGVRLQSFSDFLVENTLDYFQMFADLAAKELPLHAYSKEISFIKIFGMTGGKMNMSLIPVVDLATDKEHAGLKKNKDGTYSYAGWGDYEHHLMIDNRSFIQSIGFKDAIALQLHPGYSSNIGTIAIGVSNEHIKMMLNDPLIRMVIPYHSSGMLPEFAKQMHIDYYHDYTTTQNTTLGRCTDMDGNEVETYVIKGNDSYKCDTHYDFNEAFQRLGDARAACEEYKAWCAERHPVYKGNKQVGWAEFTPKFDEFKDEPNYYKLIEDFNSYDCITEEAAVQGAVTMNFPGMEQNLLNDEELKAYEERLRATGQFGENEIQKYVSRANETLEEIVTREAKNRNAYHREMDKKYDSTLNKIEAALQRDYNKNDYDLVNNKYVRRDGTQMSARDSSGKTLTAQQADYFKNSKIRDADGNLQVMYHGTNADFNVFDTSISGGVNGTAEGFGIYLADRSDVSDAYGDRLIKAYVNVTKPASSNKKTITRSTLKKLIKATAMSEAEKFVADGDYENVNDAVKDSWISNYTNTYEKSLSASLDDVANQLLRMDDNDMGIIQEVMAGMGIRDYADAYDFYDILKRVTGFDGFETWWTNAKNQGDPARIVLAFDSNQVKNIDNENPTESADIRYSSRDSQGKELTENQQKYFADSKVRDKDGNLIPMYHGTDTANFSGFDPEFSDDKISLFFTDRPDVAESYLEGDPEILVMGDPIEDVEDLQGAVDYSTFGAWSVSDDGLSITDGDGNVHDFKTPEETRDYFRKNYETSGVYKVYLNLKSPLEIDANGARWNELPSELNGEFVGTTTREWSEYAYEHKYDGLIIRNVADIGAYGDNEDVESTIAVAFKSNQAKSVYNDNPTENEDIRYSSRSPIVRDKKVSKAQEKRDRGELLTERQFYQIYSAHKLNLRGMDNLNEQIENIKAEGFKGDGGFGNNVVPASINPMGYTEEEMLKDGYTQENINWKKKNQSKLWVDGRYYPNVNLTQRQYGARKGDTVMFVSEADLDVTKDTQKVKRGYRPFDYEIVTVERDYQPYYELYKKAYEQSRNNADVQYSSRVNPSEYGPAFYSKLQREVENFKGNKIGAASVESYLKGKGVKDEEIKWSGIRTYLEGKKSVDKAELLQYLRDNELQIEERILGGDTSGKIWSNGYGTVNLDHFYDPVQNMEFKNEEEFRREAIKRASDDGYDESEITFNISDDYMSAESHDGDTILEAYPPDPYELRDGDYKPTNGTRWGDYRLNGGENYREVLFSIPGSDYSNQAMRTHWGAENQGVLAHARIQDFETEDGDKVLFVEEIQSDWHNAGQKATTLGKSHIETVKAASGKNLYLLKDNKSNEELGRATQNEVEEKNIKDVHGYLVDKLSVPDAPFRTTYTDYVLKNLLRMAAEGNYDYLAWTTGKMQEERWSDEFAEGYRIEYDQQIPKFLKKYGKQWGAGLKTIDLNGNNEIADDTYMRDLQTLYDMMHDINLHDISQLSDGIGVLTEDIETAIEHGRILEKDEEKARTIAQKLDNAYNNGILTDKDIYQKVIAYKNSVLVPAITVNELMKQSVLTEGQPRFSARDNGFGRNASFGTVEELERRNENIREMNYELDAVLQNRGTQTRKLSDQQIERIARRFLREYSSKADVETITNGLKSMYEYIDNTAKISAQQVGKIANSFAEQILDESKEVDDNMAQMYPELAADIKRTKLYVSPETMKEMAYYFENAADFRRQAKKFVTISEQRDGARGIDTFYEELSENFPELFDSEIVNEKDQLLQIMDVAEQLKKKTVSKDWGSEYDEIAYTLGQDMVAAYFAEKGDGSHKRNIDMIKAQMKAEHREYVDGLRRAKERQIQELKDKLTGERRQNIAKIAELRAKLNAQFRERQDKAELRRLTTQAKARLQKNARDLWSKRGTPEFEKLKAKLFSELDLVSVGISRAGVLNLEKTYNDAVRQAALDSDYAASDEYKNIELKYHGNKDNPSIERKKLRDLSYEEIVSLTEDILALKHSQQTYNRLMKDNFKATVAEYGRKGVAQQNIVTGILNQNGFRANALAAAKKYALYMENPVRAAHLLDGYQEDGVLTELFDDINNGTTKKTRFQQKTHEMFEEVLNDKELMDGWSDQNIEIEVRGQKYHISKGMRIAIALHAQNTDNIRHIENGGFNIPNERYYKQGRYTDAYNSGTRVWMSKEDMDRIAAGMTDGEKRFMRIAHDFFNKTTKDAINETSLILKGYELAVVPNYFPIRTDKNFTQAEIDGLIHDGTIEGQGQFKDRKPGAKNPILLEDVALVIDRQTQTTGAYYGIAIPVRDMNKVWNYTATAYAASMKDSIARNWGEIGKQTIEKTIRDIQMGARRGDTGDHIFSFLKGAYAASTLVGNIGVSIKQAASYPLAISMIDADCLAKGLTMKTDRAYMDSITPWSWDRRHGMGGEEMSDILKQKGMIARSQTAQNVKNFFNLIQKVDVLTTDHLFSACEAQIQKDHPKLEVRGEEYNKKVAELYNEMLWRTQPSYGVMQRNELMRSASFGMKALTMFKTQTFNMGGEILDAALRAQAMNDYAKNGLVSKAEAKRAAKALGRVMWATVLSQATLAAMTALANAVLRKMRPYRDDKGEVTGASVARKVGTDFVTSWFGLFFGADLAEQGIAAVLNFAQWYDITAPQFDRLNDTVSDLSAWTRALIDRATETDEGKKAERNAKVVKTTAKVAISATGAIGIPAQNIYNMLNAVNLLLQDTSKDGSGFLSFEAGSGLLGLTDTAPTKEQYARQAVYYSERDDSEKVAHALQGTNKSNLEKVLGSKLSKNLYESFLDDPENLAKYMNVKQYGNTPRLTDVPDEGYSSFTKLREAIGDPERTQNWHHIVEQEQGPGDGNFGNFKATQINNKNNIVSIPSGAKSPHSAISQYYDSVQDFTGGKTVREWLSTKSFEEQFDFGVKQLQKYGDIIPTGNGWVFVPDDEKIEAAMPLKKGTPDVRTEVQKQWETRMAELREDGGLTGREVRDAALTMIRDGMTADEALELYRQNQKSDKRVNDWKGSFEDYLKGRNAVDEAKAIKDSDKKRQSERRKDSIESYLRQYRGSREDELLLWKLMGYSENTFEFK